MTERKELSEQELIALDALDSAVRFAAVVPVAVCFIRRFTMTRETTKNGILQCTARITFGFRRHDADERGIASAIILLRYVLAADRTNLCHYFFVWAPASVDITVRKGQQLICARSDQLVSVAGNRSHPWVVYVKHGAPTLKT